MHVHKMHKYHKMISLEPITSVYNQLFKLKIYYFYFKTE